MSIQRTPAKAVQYTELTNNILPIHQGLSYNVFVHLSLKKCIVYYQKMDTGS